MNKMVFLICAVVLSVECFPDLSRVHYYDEKHFPVEEGKHFANLLIEPSTNRNFMIPEQATLIQDRIRRRDPEYAVRSNLIKVVPDDSYFPFAARKNYENNNDPLESQDDDDLWNLSNNDDKKDNGIWMNTYTKPHYEITDSFAKRFNSFDKIVKRYKSRQNMENYLY